MSHTPHRPRDRAHASPRAVGGRGFHRALRPHSYGSVLWPRSYGHIAIFQGVHFWQHASMPNISRHPGSRLPRLKVHRWPPIVGPYPVRVPRRDWRSRYVGTPPLRHPPSALSRLAAPASPKIAYSAAGRALAHGTMCPTHPTGRHIVPTYLLEPTRGGGATVHATFIRTRRVQRLAETG